MSEEKPLPASHKKIRDARKKGQVAKSPEIVSTGVLAASCATLAAVSPFLCIELARLADCVLLLARDNGKWAAPGILLHTALKLALWSALPLAAACLAAVFCNLAQTGVLLSLEPLKPDFNKLNPASAIKNLFSAEKLFNLVTAFVKAALILALFYHAARICFRELSLLPAGPIAAVAPAWRSLLGACLPQLLGVMAFLSLGDYLYRRGQHLKRLRMTHDELRRESRDANGNPEIKQKRVALQKEAARQAEVIRALEAAVLVTNPTHIAVGLRYSGESSELPTIACAACEEAARALIAEAESAGVPIYRDVPLARALFYDGQIDRQVPSHLLRAVGEVLRWAQEIKDSV
jgi:type III secretion protein U